MNPSPIATNAYTSDQAAWDAFVQALHARRVDCTVKQERAITRTEKTYWSKREYYLGLIERSLSPRGSGRIDTTAISRTKATFRQNMMMELTRLMDDARTTTEKEVLQGCLDAIEDGLQLHRNITGIY
jgi:hypothetical protein